jgi:SRSO17 transposase
LEDTARRDQTGIPTDLQFATKPELGVQLLSAQLAAGTRLDWCAADEVYGRDPALRELCEQHQIGYVLGVPISFPITCRPGARPAPTRPGSCSNRACVEHRLGRRRL